MAHRTALTNVRGAPTVQKPVECQMDDAIPDVRMDTGDKTVNHAAVGTIRSVTK